MVKPIWFMILKLFLKINMQSKLKEIGAGIILGLVLDKYTSGGIFMFE
jgi:cell shape-determining protein MreD